jgi:hypothetical protein
MIVLAREAPELRWELAQHFVLVKDGEDPRVDF